MIHRRKAGRAAAAVLAACLDVYKRQGWPCVQKDAAGGGLRGNRVLCQHWVRRMLFRVMKRCRLLLQMCIRDSPHTGYPAAAPGAAPP